MQRLKVKAVQIWTPSGCISCLGSSEMLVNSCDVSHEQHKYKTYKRTHVQQKYASQFVIFQVHSHWFLQWMDFCGFCCGELRCKTIGNLAGWVGCICILLVLTTSWWRELVTSLTATSNSRRYWYFILIFNDYMSHYKSRVPNENFCWTAKLWRDFLGPCDQCDSCTLRPGIDLFNHDAHAQLGCENGFWWLWAPSKSFWSIFTRRVVQDQSPMQILVANFSGRHIQHSLSKYTSRISTNRLLPSPLSSKLCHLVNHRLFDTFAQSSTNKAKSTCLFC